jgi:hypothetical protein
MSRHVAKLLCAGIGGFAAWQVYLQMVDVFANVRWLPAASAGVVFLVVFVLLYFPLMRPVSDMIEDRLSALKARVNSTRAGTGLDEIPMNLPGNAGSKLKICQKCGGPDPGGVICPKCREKLAAKSEQP